MNKQHKRRLVRLDGAPFLWRDENAKNKYVVRFTKRGERPLFAAITAKTEREAKKLAQEKIKTYLGTSVPAHKITFQLVAREIGEIKRRGRAFKTWESYDISMRLHLLPYFQAMLVCNISELDWTKYCEKQKGLNTERKLTHDKRHFLEVMNRSFYEGWTKRKLKLGALHYGKTSGKEYSDADITRLLTFANINLRLFILIGVTMGLRPGEILNLRWEEIDFEKEQLTVSWFREKTRRSRVVPLNTTHVLSILRRRSLEIADSPYVFPSVTDKNKPGGKISHQWARLLKKAKVTGRPNDLRHTCATKLLRAGVPVDDVAEFLGHSRTMLLDIYRHMSHEDRAKIANSITLPTISAQMCMDIDKGNNIGKVLGFKL